MNRILLIASSLAAYAAFLIATADACDFRLNASHGYAQQQVNYGYQQQAYVAPIVLPQIQYAPQQASYIVLPQKVEITRPEVTLRLEQATGYSYAAPLVLKQQAYSNQLGFGGGHAGYENYGSVQQFRQKQLNQQKQLQQFKQQNFRQNNGRGGILGRIQDNIQNRIQDRQDFRQQQALRAQGFRLQLGH